MEKRELHTSPIATDCPDINSSERERERERERVRERGGEERREGKERKESYIHLQLPQIVQI